MTHRHLLSVFAGIARFAWSRRALALAVLVASPLAAQRSRPPAIELRPGLIITTSARVVRKVYALRANPSVDSAVIVIRGNDITVDFQGA